MASRDLPFQSFQEQVWPVFKPPSMHKSLNLSLLGFELLFQILAVADFFDAFQLFP